MHAIQLPINRWEDKKAVVHIHNGINNFYLDIKNEILTICNSEDGPREGIMLCKISQSEKDKYHVISFV